MTGLKSDPAATSLRRDRLERYFREAVMSGHRLRCSRVSSCRGEAARVKSSFFGGQLSFLGEHYDLTDAAVPLRVLIVPMEVGAPPEYVTMASRTDQVQAVRYGSRNPHMQGVVFALQLAFGLSLAGGRANEHIDCEAGRVHVLDAFAMANLRLCSLAAAGKKSKATDVVSRNCAPHLRSTIAILQPTLVISQGKDVRPILGELFSVDRRISQNVSRVSVDGHNFVWAALHHPTRWWDRLGRPYLREVVEPTLREARQAALGRLAPPSVRPTSDGRASDGPPHRDQSTAPRTAPSGLRNDSGDYPINAADLARRLLGRPLISGDDYPFVQGEVRALLQRFGCPKETRPWRPQYIVDEEMAQRVAQELGRSLG